MNTVWVAKTGGNEFLFVGVDPAKLKERLERWDRMGTRRIMDTDPLVWKWTYYDTQGGGPCWAATRNMYPENKMRKHPSYFIREVELL